jgi:hypothetical protein
MLMAGASCVLDDVLLQMPHAPLLHSMRCFLCQRIRHRSAAVGRSTHHAHPSLVSNGAVELLQHVLERRLRFVLHQRRGVQCNVHVLINAADEEEAHAEAVRLACAVHDDKLRAAVEAGDHRAAHEEYRRNCEVTIHGEIEHRAAVIALLREPRNQRL